MNHINLKCEFREKDVNGKGCKFLGIESEWGKCVDHHFYNCPEFSLHNKTYLSFSSIRTFDTCPMKYLYSEILGYRKKEQYTSVALRAGSYLHKLIERGNEAIDSIWFSEFEEMAKINVETLFQTICDLTLIPAINMLHEQSYRNTEVRVKGVLDLVDMDNNCFGDIKATSKPESYLNNFIATDQLAYYFAIVPETLTSAYMLPVRLPALKEGKDEGMSMYKLRLMADIKKRPKFYFPEYDKGRVGFKWGRKFYQSEFNMWETAQKIEWTRKEIVNCIRQSYFPKRFANCLIYNSTCDYMSICETGGVNEDVYMIRGKNRPG